MTSRSDIMHRLKTLAILAKAKILPVTFLYYEAISRLMLAVHIQSAPINIVKLFTKTSHIHTYNTQSSKSLLFSTKYSGLNLQKRLSHVLVSKFGIRCRMNLKHQKIYLKKQMKMYLFKILGNEDSYLDVENISSKLKDCTIKTN